MPSFSRVRFPHSVSTKMPFHPFSFVSRMNVQQRELHWILDLHKLLLFRVRENVFKLETKIHSFNYCRSKELSWIKPNKSLEHKMSIVFLFLSLSVKAAEERDKGCHWWWASIQPCEMYFLNQVLCLLILGFIIWEVLKVWQSEGQMMYL